VAEELDIEEIERRAEAVLAQIPPYLWDGASLPIPVKDIADSYFGLRVCEVGPGQMAAVPGCPPLGDDQAISGLLLASRGEIWVNAEEADEWPPRGRFTICHELGHHILHRKGQQSLFCRHGSIDPDERPAETRPPLPITEEEANAFAAALLMPASLLRHQYEFCDPDDRFEQLCKIFGASGAAMGRRLHAVI